MSRILATRIQAAAARYAASGKASKVEVLVTANGCLYRVNPSGNGLHEMFDDGSWRGDPSDVSEAAVEEIVVRNHGRIVQTFYGVGELVADAKRTENPNEGRLMNGKKGGVE